MANRSARGRRHHRQVRIEGFFEEEPERARRANAASGPSARWSRGRLTGGVLFTAGLGLLVGWWTRLSAVALIAVLIPITVVVDLGHTDNLGPLFNNIALFGGLIHFAASGPGAYALTTRLGPSFARSSISASGDG